MVCGAPNPPDLRRAMGLMQTATNSLLASEYAANGNVLQYGPNLGSGRYRTELAKFLSEEYDDTVLPKNVMVTSGASSGLVLISAMLFPPGSTVFVEDPTYFIAINMLKHDFDMNVVPVPTDENGMKVDALEKLLEERFGGKDFEGSTHRPFQCMIYTVPTFHNPTGATLAPERCEKLVQLARKYESLVFCDDVYNMLHYAGKKAAPARLITYDRPSDPGYKGHVLSNGTFSKIFGPGLRLGWVEASDRLMDFFWKSHSIHSAGSANHFTSEIIAEVISKGMLRDHLKYMRDQYTETVKLIGETLRSKLPSSVKFRQLEGGYFFWVEMPEGCQGVRVAELARGNQNVVVLPGGRCSATGGYQNCVRISFSFNERAVVLQGVSKICSAINEHLAEKK
ncbi:hypothetical protein CAPTEDRAFT_183609 [Capitella teleta]|uniref:Aminotransferase class I/classII large domain-containing protein n=1 Tax=Capitella teleta TaxID=283909 RepID=R7U1D7_CAPTE|nr:hypothetical protein CAPTEDRAFT_183609 [Capitella teleta]|eukprot:ELT99789.1 hypothetical protein CAPTEDRAFT_183609 [Capitella teleta]